MVDYLTEDFTTKYIKKCDFISVGEFSVDQTEKQQVEQRLIDLVLALHASWYANSLM